MLGFILVVILFALLAAFGLRLTDRSAARMQQMRRKRKPEGIHVPQRRSKTVLWISRFPFLRLATGGRSKKGPYKDPSGDIAGF